MKRIFVFCMSFLLVLVLNGCSPVSYNVSDHEAAQNGTDYSIYASRYFYNNLSDDEKHVYDRIYDVLYKYLTTDVDAISEEADGETFYMSEPIEISVKMSFEEIAKLTTIFENENPQFFFAYFSFGFNSSGSDDNITSINASILPAYADGEARLSAAKEIFEKADAYVESAEGAASDFEKEKVIAEKMFKNLTYDEENTEEDEYNQTVAKALLSGETVCAGYSKLFSMLMNAAGVQTIVVTSTDHVWNEICLDGNWYIVDAASSDMDDGDEDIESLNWENIVFNISDESLDEIKKELSPDEEGVYDPEEYYYELNLPECKKDYQGGAS